MLSRVAKVSEKTRFLNKMLSLKHFGAEFLQPACQHNALLLSPCGRGNGKGEAGLNAVHDHHGLIETAWVILNCAGAWLGYSILSLTAGVSTAPKPDQ